MSDEMTLQEAIEEVKRQYGIDSFEPNEFKNPHRDKGFPSAIATILNAVVKGELK